MSETLNVTDIQVMIMIHRHLNDPMSETDTL